MHFCMEDTPLFQIIHILLRTFAHLADCFCSFFFFYAILDKR